MAGDEISTTTTVKDISDRGEMTFYIFESVSRTSGTRCLHGHWRNIVRSGDEPARGSAIELKVTPDPFVTVRYAGASGDFNPIHIDEVRLGRVSRAHPARAVDDGAGGPRPHRGRRRPEHLRRLSVQFRVWAGSGRRSWSAGR